MKNLIEIFRNDDDIKDDSLDKLDDIFRNDDDDVVVDEHRIFDDIFPEGSDDNPDDAKYDLDEILSDKQEFESNEEEIVEIEGRLNLTKTESNEISSVARERKFNFTKTEILYNKTYTEKAMSFINNYRFLTSIRNSIVDQKIINKINLFLKSYDKLYNDFLKFTSKISSSVNYGKSAALRQLTDRLLDNEEKINKFIDEIYSLGKVVSQYSPDADIGVQ